MELKDLSANWKKLQQTLQPVKQSANSQKRKAVSHDSQIQKDTAKKRRLLAQNGHAQDKKVNGKSQRNENMIEDGEIKSSVSLAAWAEDNDIAAVDLALAYGVGTKGTTVNVSVPERINEGLSTT